MIKAKSFGTFIRVYSLFKSERLSSYIKLTLHKALIRSIVTYDCPAWVFAADTQILQRLQNNILCITRKIPRCTSVLELHMAFRAPYIYDHLTKLYSQ
jgi:hypothetical protein